MRVSTGRPMVLGAVLVVGILGIPDWSAADSCARAKIQAIGKVESALLKCHAKVAALNSADDLVTCRQRAQDMLQALFLKAGSCTDDEARCGQYASFCADEVATVLKEMFPSRCESAKRMAAGKLINAELKCFARASMHDEAVDSDCLLRAREKFLGAMAKAGTCPEGSSPLDMVERLCVDSAVAVDGMGTVTDICPTTTTSTSSTSTSTTAEFRCRVSFSLAGTSTLTSIQFKVDYAPHIKWTWQCSTIPAGGLSAFNKDYLVDTLRAGLVNLDGITAPTTLVQCIFESAQPQSVEDFSATVVDSTTALTRLTGGSNVCGAPVTGSSPPFARDAYLILKAAVGAASCASCECDVDSSGVVAVADSLLALKASTGQSVGLACAQPCTGSPVVRSPSGAASVGVSLVSCP